MERGTREGAPLFFFEDLFSFGTAKVGEKGQIVIPKEARDIFDIEPGDTLLLRESILANPRAIKQRINVSPQESAVAPNLTVRENIELIAGIYGASVQGAKDKAWNT